jgi:hypothetical protein
MTSKQLRTLKMVSQHELEYKQHSNRASSSPSQMTTTGTTTTTTTTLKTAQAQAAVSTATATATATEIRRGIITGGIYKKNNSFSVDSIYPMYTNNIPNVTCYPVVYCVHDPGTKVTSYNIMI